MKDNKKYLMTITMMMTKQKIEILNSIELCKMNLWNLLNLINLIKMLYFKMNQNYCKIVLIYNTKIAKHLL